VLVDIILTLITARATPARLGRVLDLDQPRVLPVPQENPPQQGEGALIANLATEA
jgi:hypothetical protein